MKSLYISKHLKNEGVTREEAWEEVNMFDKKAVLHEKYIRASLLPIDWKPKDAEQKATSACIIVLTDINGKKSILLHYFYKHGNTSGNGKKLNYLFGLRKYPDGSICPAAKTLPPRLKKTPIAGVKTNYSQHYLSGWSNFGLATFFISPTYPTSEI